MLHIRILKGYFVLQTKKLLLNTKYFEQCRQIFITKHLLFKTNVEPPLLLNTNPASTEYPDEFLEETEDSPMTRMLDEIYYPKIHERLNSSDLMIMRIKKCDTIFTLFSFVQENGYMFNATHACHALLMTSKFQRENKQTFNLLSDNNPGYKQILDLVSDYNKEFTLDEVTWSLLALAVTQVPVKNETFQLLLSRFQDYVAELQDDIPLIALTCYSLAIQNSAMEHWIYINFLPMYNLVLNKLHGCTTADDVYLCTLCLNTHRELVTDSTLSSYQTIVQNMMDKNKLHAGHSDILVPILTFLNRPDWRTQNNTIMRNIMLLFREKVHLLDVNVLIELIKIFLKLQEPSCLLHEFQNSALNYFRKSVSLTKKSTLARSLIPFTFGSWHEEFQNLLDKNLQIQSTENDMSVQDFVKLYQTFKTPAVDTFYAIWTKMQSLIKSNNPEIIEQLLQLCFSYTFYVDRYNNLLHRHLGFEKEIIKWLMNDLENGECNFITWKCTRATAFILAYYPTNKSDNAIPDIVIDKLLSFSEQYSPFHCLYIAQCLRTARKIRKYQRHSTKLTNQLNKVDQVLDECMERLLKSEPLAVTQVISLMRCCTYREFEKDNDFFKKIELRTNDLNDKITSQVMRKVTFSMSQNQYVLPQIIEMVTKYIIKNKEHVLAQTVCYFVNSCYALGYTPKDTEFTAVVNEIMYRERDRIAGKLIIETALALCYFQHLSSDLIRFIFTMDFLKKLDNEIIFDKAHLLYSSKLRYFLMKLNRAVCLEFPEEDVPWFHKRYCEEKATKDCRNPTFFYKEVKETLAALVNEKNIRVDVYSPYYHKIHFLIQNNKNTKNINDRGTALILHGPNSFSNNGTYLKGAYGLNKRQLQILGYNVITLNHYIWNSMALCEPSAKLKYLSDRLQGKSEEVF